MSKREEWFRNDRWDEAEQAEFFRRLKRCKTFTRVQYLRQKALYLQRSGDPAKLDASLELDLQSGREAEEAAGKPENAKYVTFYRQWALNAQAHAADVRAERSGVEEAIAYYREAYRREGDGVPGPYVIRWAEVVYRAKRVADYPEMLYLLHSAFARDGERIYATYRPTIFLFGYYQAVLSSALGRTDAARAYARAARAVMGMPDHGIGQSLSLGTVRVSAEEARDLAQILGDGEGR